MEKMETLQVFVLMTVLLYAAEGLQIQKAIRGTTSNIRLIGPFANRGRLEVLHNDVWGTVCGYNFDNTAAEVTCKMLGFSSGGIALLSYGGGTGRVWLDGVSCSGSESDLFLDCSHNAWGYNDCGHSEDVGVECFDESSSKHQEQFRLVGETINAGRIEAYHAGQWGSICDDSFGRHEAEVACHMFGFSKFVSMGNAIRNGNGSLFLNKLKCVGNESSLLECGHPVWGINSCGKGEDARVECAYQTNNTDYMPSLVGSYKRNEGQLMLAHNGTQLYVCGNAVDSVAAKTVCNILGHHTIGAPNIMITGSVKGNTVVSSISCKGHEIFMDQCNIKTAASCTDDYASAFGLTCRESRVRLVDGPGQWTGRLEVEINGTYGTVCPHDFEDADATVACKQLFHSRGVVVNGSYTHGTFPTGRLPLKLGYLHCNGNEDELSQCPFSYSPDQVGFWDLCHRGDHVGVECKAHVPVRLVGGNDTAEGRVEIQVDGKWGPACSISPNDAVVICRMFGYWHSAPIVRGSGYFGSGSGEHVVARLNCDGSEPDVGVCQWDNSSSVCNSRHDMGVSCHTADLSSSDIRIVGDDIRLYGDFRPWRGAIQVRVHGIWGTLNWAKTRQGNTLLPVCRTLGFRWFGSPTYEQSNIHAPSFHVLESMYCNGTERNIGQCMSTDDTFPTFYDWALGVDCLGRSPLVRLCNGSHPLEGRMEILYNGQWGTVCDSGWGLKDTEVLCRSLGFESPATRYYYNAQFGPGTGPVHFTSLNCEGSEYHIAQCQSQNGSSCSHSEDIGVLCSNCVRTLGGERGSMTSSESYADCFYLIKPGSGAYKLNVTRIEKYFGYPHSVQIRAGHTWKILGEYTEAGSTVLAGKEFWVHFKTLYPRYNSVQLDWSPLHVEDTITVGCTQDRWNVSVNIVNLENLGYVDARDIYLGDSLHVEDTITVGCTQERWNVSVNIVNLENLGYVDARDIYLGDCAWASYSGPLKILTQRYTDYCNTAKKVSGNTVIYENTLSYKKSSNDPFSGDSWNFTIRCQLKLSPHNDRRQIDGALTSSVQTGSGTHNSADLSHMKN